MSNFLASELNNILLPQVTILSKRIGVTDEIDELNRKYHSTLIGYDTEEGKIPFYIERFDTTSIRGNLLPVGGVWEPVRRPIRDPKLDFDYVSSKLVNTPRGVLMLNRTNQKQYRWGIHPNNAWYTTPPPSATPTQKKSIDVCYSALFNPGYKTREEIEGGNVSPYLLGRGIAIHPKYYIKRLAKTYYLFYKKTSIASGSKLSNLDLLKGWEYLEQHVKEILAL